MKSEILNRQKVFAIVLLSLVLVFTGCDPIVGARGKVTDSTGMAVKNVVITFQTIQASGQADAQTNWSTGTFQFMTICRHCELTFSKAGYKPASVKISAGAFNGKIRDLDVVLALTNSAEASIIRDQKKVSK